MRTRDLSFTFALCASLVVHAALTLAVTESYVREFGRHLSLPALSRASIEEAAIPQLAMLRPEDDPTRRLGDSDATGYAIDSSPGEEQLLAPQGMQDQPFLSRDPVGPGKVGDPPTESLIPPGDGSAVPVAPVPPAASLVAATPEDAAPVGIPLPHEPTPKPSAPPTESDEGDDSPSVTPNDPAEGKTAVTEAQRIEEAIEPVAARPLPAAPQQPRSNNPGPQYAADPAAKGESEIDPVSMIGSVEFRRGSTVARLGRKHKLTRPRLTLGSKVDLLTMGGTALVLKIHTDETGNVTSVDVARSSGSADLDQLFKVTAYEWWFEPPKNSSNIARADTFLFTIRIN